MTHKAKKSLARRLMSKAERTIKGLPWHRTEAFLRRKAAIEVKIEIKVNRAKIKKLIGG